MGLDWSRFCESRNIEMRCFKGLAQKVTRAKGMFTAPRVDILGIGELLCLELLDCILDCQGRL